MNHPLLALVGPTASGKTEVACELSKKIPIETISCDSMQVYKDMPILTQAPVPRGSDPPGTDLKAHLVSFFPSTHEYSAAIFRKKAMELIEQIVRKKKIPCIVGGTGLYLRALLDGLFENQVPGGSDPLGTMSDGGFRERMLAVHEKHGAPFLHGRLKKIDPSSAAKIHPNDVRRIVRALEVYHLTGKPMSEQKPKRKGIRESFDCRIFFLDHDRAALYERINRRVDKMLKDGLVEEVKKIRKRKLSQTARMALGIREMGAYLDGKISREEAVRLLKKNTRNYAKRQIAWFRREKGVEFVPVGPSDSAENIADKIWRNARF